MKPRLFKIKLGNELYVFFKGKLIYKRWFNYNKGRVFHENEGEQ